MPCVTQSDRRKLLALALASLLTSGKNTFWVNFTFKFLIYFKIWFLCLCQFKENMFNCLLDVFRISRCHRSDLLRLLERYGDAEWHHQDWRRNAHHGRVSHQARYNLKSTDFTSFSRGWSSFKWIIETAKSKASSSLERVKLNFLSSSLQLGSDELVSPEDLDYETEHEHRKRHWSAKDLVKLSQHNFPIYYFVGINLRVNEFYCCIFAYVH